MIWRFTASALWFAASKNFFKKCIVASYSYHSRVCSHSTQQIHCCYPICYPHAVQLPSQRALCDVKQVETFHSTSPAKEACVVGRRTDRLTLCSAGSTPGFSSGLVAMQGLDCEHRISRPMVNIPDRQSTTHQGGKPRATANCPSPRSPDGPNDASLDELRCEWRRLIGANPQGSVATCWSG